MKLHKGDKVRITSGKDRGKEGAVEKVWPKTNQVTVAGINISKRHTKPRAEGQKGQIMDIVRPLPTSNVALICPNCKQITRVGFKLTAKSAQGRSALGGDKVRICRKCGKEI